MEVQKLNFWAAFVQLNIPLVGEANALPLVRQLDIEASWRHDQYSGDIGGTSNPKVGFNWTLSRDAGVIIRGDLGTSFRAPNFSESIQYRDRRDHLRPQYSELSGKPQHHAQL